MLCLIHQLLLKSKTIHFSQGSIIADSHESAKGLMVITSGFVNVELPMDSEEADEENKAEDGRTVLYVFGRGYAYKTHCCGRSLLKCADTCMEANMTHSSCFIKQSNPTRKSSFAVLLCHDH